MAQIDDIELQYLRDVIAEQEHVINQLFGKPSQPFTYIHPWDLGEILNSIVGTVNLVFDQPSSEDINGVFTYDGKKYKQSVHIPATNKPRFLSQQILIL